MKHSCYINGTIKVNKEINRFVLKEVFKWSALHWCRYIHWMWRLTHILHTYPYPEWGWVNSRSQRWGRGTSGGWQQQMVFPHLLTHTAAAPPQTCCCPIAWPALLSHHQHGSGDGAAVHTAAPSPQCKLLPHPLLSPQHVLLPIPFPFSTYATTQSQTLALSPPALTALLLTSWLQVAVAALAPNPGQSQSIDIWI